MDPLLRTLQILGLSALLLPLWTHSEQTPGGVERRDVLTQDLCSTVNTASTQSNYSEWQSLGLCSDYCIQKDFALAIVQYQLCWCSDVHPAENDVEGVENCSQDCPGYDVESCGRRPNRYGYYSLLKPPTSTQAASTEASTQESTTSTRPEELQAPSPPPSSSTEPEPEPETEIAQTTTSTTSSTSSTTTTSETPESSTRTPLSSAVQTVTADGTVRTVFVTPSAAPDSSGSPNTETTHNSEEVGSSSGSSGPSTGTVVGIVVGVIAGVIAVAGIVLWLFFRRRKQRAQADDSLDAPSQRGSSAGMMGTPRNPEMTVTMDGRTWDPETTSEQRRSRLMAMDPRMAPLQRGMYARSKSHESVNTIHDDQDYSRKVAKPVLRTTNPDPDD